MSTGNHTAAADHKHHYAHHFKSAMHEFISAKEGIWLFMVTEILMFGGLFVGYSIYHALYPEMFAEGASHLDWRLGFLNTLILIFSSFTMALSIYLIQTKQNQRATVSLILTLLCGYGFMIIKYFEYSHKVHLGLLPGKFLGHPDQAVDHFGLYYGLIALALPLLVAFLTDYLSNSKNKKSILIFFGVLAVFVAGFFVIGSMPHSTHQGHEVLDVTHANLGLYFSFYFCMTGLHGTHVLIGMGLILWVLIRNLRGEFDPHYFTPVEGVGIFWHIVDLIWIYLFPILYLIG